MAATASIINIPQFNFVRGEYSPTVICEAVPQQCLPMSDFRDWQWQYLVTTYGDNDGIGRNRTFRTTALKLDCIEFPFTGDLPYAWTSTQYSLTDSDYEAMIFNIARSDFDWDFYNGLLTADGFETIEPADCFRLFLYEEVTEAFTGALVARFLVACTGCFQRVEESCYLTKITSANNDNAFGEIWVNDGIPEVDDISNKALIPMYLKEPQLTSDADVFTLSDQSAVKLFEVITEEWTFETMPMLFDWHRKLKVTLAHDTLTIDNSNQTQQAPIISAGMVADADYKITWQNKPSLLGKAEGVLTTSQPVNLRNLNC